MFRVLKLVVSLHHHHAMCRKLGFISFSAKRVINIAMKLLSSMYTKEHPVFMEICMQYHLKKLVDSFLDFKFFIAHNI